MTSEITAKSLFLSLVDIEAESDRNLYLDQHCQGNEALRREVLELIRHDREGSSFLAMPVLQAPATTDQSVRNLTSQEIGPYKLMEQIGEGGMGIVYVARQQQPIRRMVALKLIKPGMDTRQVIARFQAERQALAMMNHANIAKVLDAGTTDTGLPYFVMELVKGVPITEYCDNHKLSLRQRLEIFVKVCDAVHHAHQKGIIHRDLKPSNVLVELDNVRAIPKVIDFGVAKATQQSLTENTVYTGIAQVIGTPLYMSPEQAQLNSMDVDTRSDIYSLGVLLYELLTGNTPFDRETLIQAGFDEMRRIIREDQPPRPSRRVTTLKQEVGSTTANRQQIDLRHLSLALQSELDWIVMKALEKDRNRRYASAIALADDVQRYLDDAPVQACPPSFSYRLKKLSRQYRGTITVAALIAVALILGLAGTSWQAFRAARAESDVRGERDKLQIQERQAVEQRDLAMLSQYYAEIVSGQADWDRGYLHRLYYKLIRHLPLSGEPDRRGWEWYYLMSLCRPEQAVLRAQGRLMFANWSPDGELIAGGGNIWQADSLMQVRQFWPSMMQKYRGAWRPDSQIYAWGCTTDDNGIYFWDRQTDTLSHLRGHTSSVWAVTWSPDGKRLASGGMDRTIKIWDADSKALLRSMDTGEYVTDLAWSPDGLLLASGDGTRKSGLMVWNTETGDIVYKSEHGELRARQVSWHPDGTLLAVCTSKDWSLIRRADWQVERQETFSDGLGGDVSWSPDGKNLAVSDGELVGIWDPKLPQAKRMLRGHLRPVLHLSWSPDGRRIVTSDGQEDMRIWDLASEPEMSPRAAGRPLAALTFAADDQTLLAVEKQVGNLLALKRDSPPEVLSAPPTTEGDILWSPNQRFVAVRQDAEVPEIVVWNRAGEIHARWRGEPESSVSGMGWSPDETRLAVSQELNGNKGCVTVWNVDRERQVCRWLHTSKGTSWGNVTGTPITWSPDGTKIMVSGRGEARDDGRTGFHGHVYIFDANQGTTLLKHNLGRDSYGSPVTSMAWAPNAQTVVIGTQNGLIQAVRLDPLTVLFSSRLLSTPIRSLAWSPDGQRIAAAAEDGSIRLLAAVSGDDLLSFDLKQGAQRVSWSKDGRSLAAATADGEVHVWSAAQAYKLWDSSAPNGELAWANYMMLPQESGTVRRARLQEVLRRAPDALGYWELRGRVLAALGDFERAAKEFAKLTASGVERDLSASRLQAYALLATGDRQAFDRHCMNLLKAYGHSAVPSNGGLVAELTSFIRESTDVAIDRKQAVELAGDWALGGCLYRDAQYEEAAKHLSDTCETMERSADPLERASLAQALCFLAMARHQMQHSLQARRYLEEAAHVALQIQESDWVGRIATSALDEEARKLIGK